MLDPFRLRHLLRPRAAVLVLRLLRRYSGRPARAFLAAVQIKAAEDTWHWDENAARSYQDVVEHGGGVSQAMQAFRTFLGESDMLAYLAMMAPRLVELRRVLKSTGSLWLHCDLTVSHYLKMLLDSIFVPRRLLNEVTWKRSSAHDLTEILYQFQ